MKNLKQQVAKEIAKRVTNGMVLGIGSGSTVWLAIEEIGKRIAKEKMSITALAAAKESAELAASHGIKILPLLSDHEADWCFDGADEVDPGLNLIKGRWGAQTKEKILVRRSKKFIVIVDESKIVKKLGATMPVPIEVLPEGRSIAERELALLGAKEIVFRKSKDNPKQPFLTEYGNYMLDVTFKVPLTAHLERAINSVQAVVENGLFFNVASEVLVAGKDGVEVLTK